jgi:hypothetical protein
VLKRGRRIGTLTKTVIQKELVRSRPRKWGRLSRTTSLLRLAGRSTDGPRKAERTFSLLGGRSAPKKIKTGIASVQQVKLHLNNPPLLHLHLHQPPHLQPQPQPPHPLLYPPDLKGKISKIA